jgi:signal transduction histidine kinase/streptogramin lyase
MLWLFNGGDVFQRITIEDGLSQNMVNDILLDDRGFLWFATKDGLNRYDGYSFTVYRNYPGQQETLTSNHITSLWQSSNGSIWMTTNGGGVNRLSPATGVTESITGINTPDVSFSLQIKGDSRENLWVLSQSDGLVHINPETREFVALHSKPGFSTVGVVSYFDVTSKDHIWTVSSEVIQYMSPKDSLLLKWTVKDPSDRPTSMLVLSDSLLLFTTRTGLHYLQLKDNTLIRKPTSVQGYSFGYGNMLSRDQNGRIWLASLTDMYQFDPTYESLTWLFMHNTRPTKGFISDHSGIVWIGTAGWGIIQYNPSRQYLRRGIGFFPPLIIPDVLNALQEKGHALPDWSWGVDYAIFTSNTGDVWLSTMGFQVFKYSRTTEELRNFNSRTSLNRYNLNRGFNRLLIGNNGRIWLAGSGGLFELLEESDELVYHPIYEGAISDQEYINRTGNPDIIAIAEDASGRLWMGTPDRGVVSYDPQSGEIARFSHNPSQPGSISSNQILSVLVDPLQSDQYIWIGTDGGGLNRLHIQTGHSDVFFTTDGLPSMVIYAILPDDDRNLWLSTNNGLARMNLQSHQIRRFSTADGTHSREFNRYEYFRHTDGTLFFGGIGGFTQVIPALYKPNTNEPRIRLTNFLLFNRVADVGFFKQYDPENQSPLRLRYDQNMITLEFAALEFTASGSNRYRYRMDGFDKDWIEAGFSRSATYTNLAPGSYTFLVQAANSDGYWSPAELRVPLYITPPYWMTWWFRFLLIVAIASSIWIIVRTRLQQLRREKARQEEVTLRVIEKQEEERRRIAHEMHDGLGQELLVLKNMLYRWAKRPEMAEPNNVLQEASEQMSGILKSVREITHDLRPPELDRIGITETIRYTLEKTTASAGIKLTADIQHFNSMIPKEHEINLVRIIQEMLSNTIKHAEASEVNCNIQVTSNHLLIQYGDNGKGLKSETDTTIFQRGLGMSGMAERVRILGGTLNWLSNEANGLVYEIRIPLTKTFN